MKIFNFFELFFIVSLAIMFILVGMLMYHIRSQLTEAEKRTDNLFDIVTNLSNELNAQKVHMANLRYAAAGGAPTLIPFQPPVKKILVSDDGAESDDGAAADAAAVDDDSYTESFDEDLTGAGAEAGEEVSIHVIKFPLYQDPDEIELVVENIEADGCVAAASAAEPEEINVPDAHEIEKVLSLDLERHGIDEEIEADVTTEIDAETSSFTADAAEDIHKMNLSALRKLVSERGLVSSHDAAKMKKADIITILTNV